MQSQRLITLLLVFILLLMSASSCRNGGNVSNNSGGTVGIRIGVFPKGLQAPIYLIVKKHKFLEKHGLQPTFYEFGLLPAMTQAFAANETDVIWIGITQAADMRNKGVPLKVILAHANAAERVLVQPGSKVNSISDLKGKKVGTPGEGTTAHTLFRIIAKELYKIDPDKDLTFVKASEDNLSRFLMQGEIDAAILKIETFSTIEENKARVISVLSEEWKRRPGTATPFILLSSTFREEYVRGRREAVRKYIIAMKEANEYASTHQEELIQLLSEQFSMSADAARKYTADWNNLYFCDLSSTTRDTITKEWESMVAAGDLTTMPKDVFEAFAEAENPNSKVMKQAQ